MQWQRYNGTSVALASSHSRGFLPAGHPDQGTSKPKLVSRPSSGQKIQVKDGCLGLPLNLANCKSPNVAGSNLTMLLGLDFGLLSE